MGLLLLIAPLAVIAAPISMVIGIFETASATFTDIIAVWTNFFA